MIPHACQISCSDNLFEPGTAAVTADLGAGSGALARLALLRLSVRLLPRAAAPAAVCAAAVLATAGAPGVAHSFEGRRAVLAGAVAAPALHGVVALAVAAATRCDDER
jgi:peptidoglycan/LPS O-acetylase OafA/YrhL